MGLMMLNDLIVCRFCYECSIATILIKAYNNEPPKDFRFRGAEHFCKLFNFAEYVRRYTTRDVYSKFAAPVLSFSLALPCAQFSF